MSDTYDTGWPQGSRSRLARLFWRLGRIGFIAQLVLLVPPILLAVYVLLLSSPDSPMRRGIDLGNYLSYGSLIVMIFTTFWFYRYMRIGRALEGPATCPTPSSVNRTLWVGLWASGLGIVFSMLLLFGAAGRMLFVLLATPQTGLMIAPALGESPGQSISAIDVISFTSLLIILAAELIVLGMTLWLLYRTFTPPDIEIDAPAY